MQADYKKEWGLVAILDALGASNYTDEEIKRFLTSRERALNLFDLKAEGVLGRLKKDHLSKFTFNDTLVIAYRTDRQSTLDDVEVLFTLVRKLLVDALANRILLRGSVASGWFYVDDQTNTILGPAVTDAAAWYDRADWIGVHATPHATLTIASLMESDNRDLKRLVVDYPVPLRGGTTTTMKAVNWPKAFFVSGLTPCQGTEQPRAKCLELLTKHSIPHGTESKYYNSLEFFDHVVKTQKLKTKTTSAS